MGRTKTPPFQAGTSTYPFLPQHCRPHPPKQLSLWGSSSIGLQTEPGAVSMSWTSRRRFAEFGEGGIEFGPLPFPAFGGSMGSSGGAEGSCEHTQGRTPTPARDNHARTAPKGCAQPRPQRHGQEYVSNYQAGTTTELPRTLRADLNPARELITTGQVRRRHD